MKNVKIIDTSLYKLAAAIPDVSCLIDKTELQNNPVALFRLVRLSVYNQTLFNLAFGFKPKMPTCCAGANVQYVNRFFENSPRLAQVSPQLKNVFLDVNQRVEHLKDFLEESAYPDLDYVESAKRATKMFADATDWMKARLVRNDVVSNMNQFTNCDNDCAVTFSVRKNFQVVETIPA
jgi:hypothetical protein